MVLSLFQQRRRRRYIDRWIVGPGNCLLFYLAVILGLSGVNEWLVNMDVTFYVSEFLLMGGQSELRFDVCLIVIEVLKINGSCH